MFAQYFTHKEHNALNDAPCKSVIARPLRPWQSRVLKCKAWIARAQPDTFVEDFSQ